MSTKETVLFTDNGRIARVKDGPHWLVLSLPPSLSDKDLSWKKSEIVFSGGEVGSEKMFRELTDPILFGTKRRVAAVKLKKAGPDANADGKKDTSKAVQVVIRRKAD